MKKLLLFILTLTFSVGASYAEDVVYDFMDKDNYPSAFPTSSGTSSDTEAEFTMEDGNKFSLKTANSGSYYAYTYSGTTGLYVGKNVKNFESLSETAYIKFPAKTGFTITKIVITTASRQGGDIKINVYNSSASAVSETVTTSTVGEDLTFVINSPVSETPYYVCVEKSNAAGKNMHFRYATITYTPNAVSLNGDGFATFSNTTPVTISGAEAYKASVAGNEITLTSIGTSIPANEGVILYGTAGANVTVSSATSPVSAVEGNALKASSVAVEDGYAAWVLNGNQFLEYTGAVLAPNKAYIPRLAASPANALRLVFDNESTDIQNVENTMNNGVVYNLAGQRVSANAKGIVIVNGKKYVDPLRR